MEKTYRIERVHRDKLPAGTKILTENEVFEHYFGLFQKWKPGSEVWPFKYGLLVLGAASCTANFFILRQYRQRLKLNSGTLAVMTFGFAFIPSVMSPIAHAWYVTKKIFVQEQCMACIHIRAIAFQLASALGYALTVNPLLCFLKAQHLGTYNVPGYYTPEQRQKTWTLYKKFTRRAGGSIYLHTVINSVAASAITASEIKNFIVIQEKMQQKDQELKNLKKVIPQ